MKLANLRHQGRDRLGVVLDEGIVDLAAVAPDLPTDPLALLAAGPDALDAARAAAAGAAPSLALDEVQLLAPVPRPPKLLAIGLNYADHAAESATEAPEVQLWFNKQATCVIGPGEAIEVPAASSLVDYEGELAVVIGQRCRHVPVERALDVVAGYTVINDVSVRDWQLRSPTMTMGKSFDTHGPLGPWLVTTDEIPDPQALHLTTEVDGVVRQDAGTDQMVHGVAEQIAHLTEAFTLEPGDVLATGTPAGVGISRQPPVLLAAGSTVRITIEGIGTLENPVVDEVVATRIG